MGAPALLFIFAMIGLRRDRDGLGGCGNAFVWATLAFHGHTPRRRYRTRSSPSVRASGQVPGGRRRGPGDPPLHCCGCLHPGRASSTGSGRRAMASSSSRRSRPRVTRARLRAVPRRRLASSADATATCSGGSANSEFDEIFDRVRAWSLPYWADPAQAQASEINHTTVGAVSILRIPTDTSWRSSPALTAAAAGIRSGHAGRNSC